MKSDTSGSSSANVNLSLFQLITPSMVLCTTGFFVVSYMLRERLNEGFWTAPQLNATIFFIIFWAIYKAFANNYDLYRTLRFLKKVEKAEESSDTDRDSIESLKKSLNSDGAMLNIQNMHGALDNLSVYGHMNFTDNDARLIKSKFGSRMRHERNVVSYLSGILVMMGLIGTFWGLLDAIDDVGEAMSEVSHSFDAPSQSGGGDNLGAFIQKIAAPLEGMGVAFSASLFGLAGSLFLGFLNFFGGHAQNNFVEEVSRWIDLRIPKLNPHLQDKTKGQNVPKSDDLKAWLAGFVYLSTKSNQKMGQIALALSRSNDAMQKSIAQTEKIHDYQKDIFMATERMGARMGAVKDSLQYISQSIDPSLRLNSSIRDSLFEISGHLSHAKATGEDLAFQQINRLSQLTQQMHDVNTTFQVLSQVQANLVSEVQKLRETGQKGDNTAALSNLVWEMNSILEEIRQGNTGTYMSIFPDQETNGSKKRREPGPDGSAA
ncbi:MAG: hypothetical protein IPH06_08120 [Alphaproteobacteria bacterium]|jgi:hypothetical protein|nr:hypothetical protein [Alphaproteobacteria bacterium]QQS57965.1 MAG: hypothetical protein IPN28_03880 [Alphaproteobacteria bacterium]